MDQGASHMLQSVIFLKSFCKNSKVEVYINTHTLFVSYVRQLNGSEMWLNTFNVFSHGLSVGHISINNLMSLTCMYTETRTSPINS